MKSFISSKKMCISCGACVFVSHGKIQLEENSGAGMYYPKIVQKLTLTEISNIRDVCPADGYMINSMSEKIFGKNCKYDYRIGRYHDLLSIKSCSDKLLQKASSGGIMTSLPMYLLKKNIVQGIVATVFIYGKGGIFPFTKIFTTPDELLNAQGSKYMPVPALTVLGDILKFDGQVAFIGTPCQIASLRLLQGKDPLLKEKIKYTIGNFCGGFKDLRELHRFKAIAKMNDETITHFQYRGDGQPGRMLFQSESGKSWERAYSRYSGLTGYIKNYRCRVCIDATAELADISCGDAWLSKYLDNGGNWSIIIVRNPEILYHISQMESEIVINVEKLGLDELVLSQKQNITSKKERYLGRNNFLKKTGHIVPVFDSGWNENKKTSFFFEAKVYYSQLYIYWMEKIRLYSLLRVIVKKITNK